MADANLRTTASSEWLEVREGVQMACLPSPCDGAFCVLSCGEDGIAVFVKVMLGRGTGITLQNEAESLTAEVKPLPGDTITRHFPWALSSVLSQAAT